MAYTISVKPGAEEDIDHAYNWYEDQRGGLGDEFLTELEVYYKKLEQQPAVFGKASKSFRQAVLKRFPYIIVFEVSKTEVIIYAVFHKSRNPKNKLRRK
jgi:plasmid stabilization system protein ParE